ncbi:hypothetical protein Q8F55_003523 [Vanrija albida]|uniref:cAMP-dependent protein kinase regulatory subunit n=1 Tax=Vanrija albida TaxID=181172 RepID=A0ABR3Q485_9TREE
MSAGSNPQYNSILNDLNRDVSRENPKDILQFCADWFQDRLRDERSGSKNQATSPSSKGSGKPGKLDTAGGSSAFGQWQSGELSPSERGPDGPSPFGGAKTGAALAAGAGGAAAVGAASLFSSPFGGSARSAAPPTDDADPFDTSAPAPGGPFGNSSFGASPFGASAPVSNNTAHDEDDHDEPEPVIPSYALGRRTSVSAESLVPKTRSFDPSANAFISEEDEETPDANNNDMPVFPKTDEQLRRIRGAIKPNFLFRNLDEEQEADVLAAMKEVTVAPGETVIEQGASGDYFYVVESGELDIFVKRDGQVLEPEKGDRPDLGKKVATSKEGGSFGELALMHNAPRAASIVAVSPSTLWALDRVSFRTILLDHTSRKRRLYESFLSTVAILTSLQPSERAKIADVLESRTFEAGQDIIKEGEAGDEFFLIENGSAVAIKTIDGKETVVKNYGKGDYFGELALLNRQNRAATVRASEKLRVAALGEQAFTRLLGPAKDIMARSAGERYGYAVGR